MKLINIKPHAVVDYLLSATLILMPWLYGFGEFGLAQNIPMVVGVSIIVYSAFTNYELSIIRLISMRVHLTLDMLSGIFLAVSPWLFDFADYIYIPHLIFGTVLTGVALLTNGSTQSVKNHTINAS